MPVEMADKRGGRGSPAGARAGHLRLVLAVACFAWCGTAGHAQEAGDEWGSEPAGAETLKGDLLPAIPGDPPRKPTPPKQGAPKPFPAPTPAATAPKPPAQGIPAEVSPEGTLLALLAEEKSLLAVYGKDHPQVISVRERLRAVREHLASRPAPRPVEPEPIRSVSHAQPAPLPPQMTGPNTGLVCVPMWYSDGNSLARILDRPATAPTPPSQPPAPAPAQTVVVHANPEEAVRPQPATLAGTLLQVVAVLVVVLGVLGAALAGLVFAFRRFGGNLSPLIQVHLTNTQTAPHDDRPVIAGFAPFAPAPPAWPNAAPPGVAAPPPAAPDWLKGAAIPAPPPPVPEAQPFDLGPTYEEARALEAVESAQRDTGIFQQVFEANLRLRDEIAKAGAVPDDAGTPPGPQTPEQETV